MADIPANHRSSLPMHLQMQASVESAASSNTQSTNSSKASSQHTDVSVLLPGYRIDRQLHSSPKGIVFEGVRENDQLPIIVKCLVHVTSSSTTQSTQVAGNRHVEAPTSAELHAFKREATLTQWISAQCAGVVKCYGIEQCVVEGIRTYAIVLENIGGQSLNQLRRPLPLAESLIIGIQLCQSLAQLHRNNVIHKDVSAGNIIVAYKPNRERSSQQSSSSDADLSESSESSEVNLTLDDIQLGLIDFGQSSLLSRETASIATLRRLEGTIHYLAPEQTGRMNRSVDYRADLYSAGVCLYELLTGQLPFTGEAMEVIHGHIARDAIAPHQINADVPPVVSDIVMKLLAKDADERYQSGLGCAYDLQKCLHQLQQTGSVDSFAVGQNDVQLRLQISERLYGREKQVEQLLTALETITQSSVIDDAAALSLNTITSPVMTQRTLRSSRTNRASQQQRAPVYTPTLSLVLVSGLAGAGKTSVIDELSRACLQQGVVLARGKFAQVNTTPFVAWQQALTQLVDIALTSSAKEESAWRTALKTALGPNAAVLIDIVPSLAALIGNYPPVAALPPSESLARFQESFVNAIVAFASSELETPVVVFIDDNHWADGPSIKLLELLVSETYDKSSEQANYRSPRLMVIAAYRPDATADSQETPTVLHDASAHADLSPWTHFVQQCMSRASTAWPLTTIELPPLELGDIVHLLADTLMVEPRKVERLALTCYQRTRGAPLFIKQWLTELHERGLLTLRVSEQQQPRSSAAEQMEEPSSVSDASSRGSSMNSASISDSTGSLQPASEQHAATRNGNNGGVSSPTAWQWDDTAISSLQMSSDVVALMSNRISHFPADTQHVLAVAAALGSSFQFGVLAAVLQKSDRQLTTLLWPAVKAGLVYPLGTVLLEPDLQDADMTTQMTSMQAKLSSNNHDSEAASKPTPESDDDIIAKTDAANAASVEASMTSSDDEVALATVQQQDKRRSTELQYISVLSVAHEQSSPANVRRQTQAPTSSFPSHSREPSSIDDNHFLGLTAHNKSELRNAYFKFSHDRIVGACMATLSQSQLRKLHQQIGQQLLQQLKEELRTQTQSADSSGSASHVETTPSDEEQLVDFLRLVTDANSETVLRIIHHSNLAYGLIELPAPDTSDDHQAAADWQRDNQANNDLWRKLPILQQDELAHLNMIATQRAKVYTAYKVAVDYARAGLSIVSPEYWASGNDRQYKLILSLYNALAELEMVLGSLTGCKQAAEMVLQHARTAVDKTDAYVALITHATATAAYRHGLQVAVDASRALGFPLDDVESNIGKPYTDLALQKLNRLRTQQVMCDIVDRYNQQRGVADTDARQELREQGALLEEHDAYSGYELGQPALPLPKQTREALSVIPQLPDATDVSAISAMSIVSAGAICSMLENPLQRDLMGCTVLQLALKLNAIPSSVATNLCFFGVGLAFRHNVADIGYEIATQAYELASRRQDPNTCGRVLYLRGIIVGHLHKPMRSFMPDYKQSHQLLKLGGDALYKVYTAVVPLMAQVVFGMPLTELEPVMQPHLTMAIKAGNSVAQHVVVSVRSIVENLQGRTAAPSIYDIRMPNDTTSPLPIDEPASIQLEQRYTQSCFAAQDIVGVGIFWSLKTMTCLLYGDLLGSLKAADIIHYGDLDLFQLLDGVPPITLFVTYSTLAAIRVLRLRKDRATAPKPASFSNQSSPNLAPLPASQLYNPSHISSRTQSNRPIQFCNLPYNIQASRAKAIIARYEERSLCLEYSEAELQRRIDQGYAHLKTYAASNPHDYQHKLLLVQAELAYLRGETKVSKDQIAQAVELAEESGFLYDAAIAQEAMVRCVVTESKTRPYYKRYIPMHLQEAIRLYSQYGARAKLVMLAAQYPEYSSSSHLQQVRPVQQLSMQASTNSSVFSKPTTTVTDASVSTNAGSGSSVTIATAAAIGNSSGSSSQASSISSGPVVELIGTGLSYDYGVSSPRTAMDSVLAPLSSANIASTPNSDIPAITHNMVIASDKQRVRTPTQISVQGLPTDDLDGRLHLSLDGTSAAEPERLRGGISDNIDAVSVARAAQLLSGEIHLDKLLRTLLGLILNNAGANLVQILSEREANHFVTEATANLLDAANPDVQVFVEDHLSSESKASSSRKSSPDRVPRTSSSSALYSAAADDHEEEKTSSSTSKARSRRSSLPKITARSSSSVSETEAGVDTTDVTVEGTAVPLSVLKYVARTRLHLIIDNAYISPRFRHDAYVQRNKTKSIMCLPLISSGKLVAVLYLENRTASAAFTQDRLTVCRVLAAQAAISIDNARLYRQLNYNNQQLESKVAQRTRALRRAIQHAEEAAAAAESANAAKSTFLANMSHEIRTPMNGILGMTSILMESELSQDQREAVSIVRSSGEALLTLINDILDLSKIESGKLALDASAFQLRSSVEASIDVLADKAHLKGLAITVLVDPSVPVSVCGDKLRLRQCLLNLVGNSIKFTASGHVSLSVTAKLVEEGKLDAMSRSLAAGQLGSASPSVTDLGHTATSPLNRVATRGRSSSRATSVAVSESSGLSHAGSSLPPPPDFQPSGSSSIGAASAASATSFSSYSHSSSRDTAAHDEDDEDLHLSTEEMKQTDDWPLYEVEFQVTDTGIGIDSERSHLLFQTFSQLQTNVKFGGTGLGLAISKKLASLMQGDLKCYSAGRDKGSTFTFTARMRGRNDLIVPSDIQQALAVSGLVDGLDHPTESRRGSDPAAPAPAEAQDETRNITSSLAKKLNVKSTLEELASNMHSILSEVPSVRLADDGHSSSSTSQIADSPLSAAGSHRSVLSQNRLRLYPPAAELLYSHVIVLHPVDVVRRHVCALVRQWGCKVTSTASPRQSLQWISHSAAIAAKQLMEMTKAQMPRGVALEVDTDEFDRIVASTISKYDLESPAPQSRKIGLAVTSGSNLLGSNEQRQMQDRQARRDRVLNRSVIVGSTQQRLSPDPVQRSLSSEEENYQEQPMPNDYKHDVYSMPIDCVITVRTLLQQDGIQLAERYRHVHTEISNAMRQLYANAINNIPSLTPQQRAALPILPPLPGLAVLMSTSLSQLERQSAAIENNVVTAYITKPVKPLQLFNALRMVCVRRRAGSPLGVMRGLSGLSPLYTQPNLLSYTAPVQPTETPNLVTRALTEDRLKQQQELQNSGLSMTSSDYPSSSSYAMSDQVQANLLRTTSSTATSSGTLTSTFPHLARLRAMQQGELSPGPTTSEQSTPANWLPRLDASISSPFIRASRRLDGLRIAATDSPSSTLYNNSPFSTADPNESNSNRMMTLAAHAAGLNLRQRDTSDGPLSAQAQPSPDSVTSTTDSVDSTSASMPSSVTATPRPPTSRLNINMSLDFPLRVLVAEDNLVNQKVVLQVLKRLGYTADVVDNGFEAVQSVLGVKFAADISMEEALAQCKSGKLAIRPCTDPHSYDVILCDIQMPILDGFGAVEMIRAARRHSCRTAAALPALPMSNGERLSSADAATSRLIRGTENEDCCPVILALTANAFKEDKIKCLASGFNGYCSKPLRVPTLVQELKRAHALIKSRQHE